MNASDRDFSAIVEDIASAASAIWTSDPPTAPRSVPLEYQASLLVWQICPPCLLLLGTFGNVATVLVMRRVKDENSSQQRAVLIALAVADLSLLYISAFRIWLIYLFDVNLVLMHSIICKLRWWLTYAVNSSCAWLLTFVTVQRTLAVKWPHKMRVMCTLRRTRVIIATIVGVALVVHSHFLLGMDLNKAGDNCYFGDFIDYKPFYVNFWLWVDTFTYSVIPFVCLLGCNVVLSQILFQASSMSSASVQAVASSAHSEEGRKKTASRTTVMILAVSTAFLVLTLPSCVFFIINHFAYDCLAWYSWELVWAVTYQLWYLNSSINFLLYCLTGTKFRREFWSLISCRGVTKYDHASSRGREKTAMDVN